MGLHLIPQGTLSGFAIHLVHPDFCKWLLAIIITEIIFGLISNSFALIADALHNTADVIAIVITYIALKLGAQQTTFQYTFGFLKAEMMATFVNTLFLCITMFYMIYVSIMRLFNPEPIEPIYMIVVGFIAILANGISAYLLHNLNVSSCIGHDHAYESHNHQDANIKSAYLHMLSDALISAGVVVAGILIYFFGIYSIDTILTVIFSIYILLHTFPLLKQSFLSLMDANTHDICLQDLTTLIQTEPHILEFHDLHITEPSSKHSFISFHVVLDDEDLTLQQIETITDKLRERLTTIGFTHTIIQVDSKANIRHQSHCSIGGAA